MVKTNCELCVNYVYDEEMEEYQCLVNLDEDEIYRFIQNDFKNCPYFRIDDEYSIAKKQ